VSLGRAGYRHALGVEFDTEAVDAMTELPVWARDLDLMPDPEGGWFKEMWRSDLAVSRSALPSDYTGPRRTGSTILLLPMPGQQSAWHTCAAPN
jgi:predicted cupin superfamily sugar epimerase